MVFMTALISSFLATGFSQDSCRLLVWSDEFEYTGLPDTLKWGYDVGDGCDYGICNWGNLEAQYYTFRDPENARVEDGKLIIEARKELTVNKKYSSARLVTRDIMQITYGRIEFRAKLAGGAGTWNALWLLGDREELGWPDCGEIDIMEYVGAEPGIVRGTPHQASAYGGGAPSARIQVPDAETEFHTYTIEWNPDSIVWFMDDLKFNVYYNEYTGEAQWPYDRSFYLLMNLAVGGTLGGPIDNGIFDDTVAMEVDYIRIYQNPEEAGIRGKSKISKNESNLEYSCLIPANKYNWTVPEGVTIVEGDGTSSIIVDWDCEEGSVGLEVETDCDTVSISLPVMFQPREISGRQAVYQNESGISFSVPPVSGGTYNWTVPGDAVISSGESDSEMTVNWGCSVGQISVDITGSCLQEEVAQDIEIVPLGLTGPGYLSKGTKDIEFYIDSLHAGTYLWSFPEGVVINSGVDSYGINVDWGTDPGFVIVAVTNSCGVMKDSILVSITSDLIIADFDVVDPDWLVFSGSNYERAENPSKTGLNISDLVGLTYKDATAATWAGFYTDLNETMDFSSGALFSLLSFAQRTGNVLFKIENSLGGGASPVEISVPITKTNEWEQLFFDFKDAATDSYNRVTLFFDFGQVYTDTFYFDNVILHRSAAEVGITVSQDTEITEGNEDGAIIRVYLSGDMFTETLNASNWSFNNLPAGVTVGTLTRVSNTEAELVLAGNATEDYDENITDFSVTVSADELILSGVALSKNTGVVFTALIEDLLETYIPGKLRVYPNPATDVLNIVIDPVLEGELDGWLTGIRGEKLQTFKCRGGEVYRLDISMYAPGCYMLLLKGEMYSYQHRVFIIKRK
ncbi:MAG: glycoside hydrolase family 16 protein [Bacteroidales bacterium]|nr:glycoside hydrolase family 16 protein [Bacteroidales bacterium]